VGATIPWMTEGQSTPCFSISALEGIRWSRIGASVGCGFSAKKRVVALAAARGCYRQGMGSVQCQFHGPPVTGSSRAARARQAA